MLLRVPSIVKRFCEPVRGESRPRDRILGLVITAALTAAGRRSVAQWGRLVVELQRYRGTLTRLLSNHRFRTRDMSDVLSSELSGKCLRGDTRNKRWFLIVDGTHTRRGGRTKIDNARRFHPPGAKPGTRVHTFVFGLLLAPDGTRIPLPRMTWRTKAYAKRRGKPYVSQVDLSCELIKIAKRKLPEDVELVVLADSQYHGRKLPNYCKKQGCKYIVELGHKRGFADPRDPERSGKKIIVNRARSVPWEQREELTLVSGTEETASYRRYPAGKRRRKSARRCYRLYREQRAVAALGEVNLTYSWKSKDGSSGGFHKGSQPKLLASNDLELSAAHMVEFYELRWQIELFFRELKSDLGLKDYRGVTFEAFERYVDIILMAFMCLEDFRLDNRRGCRGLRTNGLRLEFMRQAVIDDSAVVERLLRTKEGRKRLAEWIIDTHRKRPAQAAVA